MVHIASRCKHGSRLLNFDMVGTVCHLHTPPYTPLTFSSSPLLQTGSTALMMAAGAGHSDVVRILLDAGVNANLQDKVSVLVGLYSLHTW